MIINFNESNLCSGELLGNKFIVPCNPEEYLSLQYGKDKWKLPLKEGYFNYNSINFYKEWTDDEWPNAVRWYNTVGEVDVQKTLNDLNRNAKIPIKKLPFAEL